MKEVKDFKRIFESLGFYLDYNQWDEKGWVRFQPNILRMQDVVPKEFVLIVYKGEFFEALTGASNILFMLGQKSKIEQFNTLTPLIKLI